MGFLSKIGKGLKFGFSHVKKIFKGMAKNPLRLLTGGDPLSTKIHNKVFGTKYKPLFTQLGGATEQQFQDYEAKNGKGSLGFARGMQKIADTVAMFYAGGALTKVGGKLAGQAASKFGAGAAPSGATSSAAGTPVATAADGMQEVVVTAAKGGAAPVAGATGAGIGAAGAGQSVPGGTDPAAGPIHAPMGATPAPAAAPAGGGLLNTVKNAVTSEAGLAIIGGALQGYSSDSQQKRAIEEQRKYTRPFTTQEIEGITRGMDVKVPGGFLENARRVGEFLNGTPRIGPSAMTPEQVAGMARGG